MFCTLCEKSERRNAFTSGCDKLKADAIRKHTQTTDHKFAVSTKEENGDLDRTILKIVEKEREAVKGL